MDGMNRVTLELAQAYVPVQIFVNRWEPKKALMMGTIFPELYRPYVSRDRERRG
ncbi:MAG TPA: spore coat associated protein CotJA [Bacillota bacterium]